MAYMLTIINEQVRANAIEIARAAPLGTRVEFKGPKRTLEQNKRMWAALTDISLQLKWCGEVLKPNDWKTLFIAALEKETRVVPGINGSVVTLGRSSSDLSKQEMSDLMELMAAFGAEHGVKFSDPRSEAA